MSCAQVDCASSAAEMVGAELQVTASSPAGSDAFTADLPVLAPQDQVFVATQMAVTGSAGGAPWAEGLACLADAVRAPRGV
jgi:hypothetical protein